jgi:hypothetical protein
VERITVSGLAQLDAFARYLVYSNEVRILRDQRRLAGTNPAWPLLVTRYSALMPEEPFAYWVAAPMAVSAVLERP